MPISITTFVAGNCKAECKMKTIATITMCLWMSIVLAAQPTETVLYSFKGTSVGGDGQSPASGLVFDSAGNLYGTTAYGGAYQWGTVFKLSPGSNGWTETILHSFGAKGDGALPAGLIFDNAGNLYGATGAGGKVWGAGTVFELSPSGNGQWTETLIYQFNGTDGANPNSNLVFDAAGNLYGTAQNGGSGCVSHGGCGFVFELSPSNGHWLRKTLHVFGRTVHDGLYPDTTPVFDAAGNLYGIAIGGGLYGYGAVYKLTPKPTGLWPEKIIQNMPEISFGGLTIDSAGNLYGTQVKGGKYGAGNVWELSLNPATGKWVKSILFNFYSNSSGQLPASGVVFDSAGNLYGTTTSGGERYGCRRLRLWRVI
jgi:uncharacterized repeat protein (TIGR03803 family)